MARHLVSRKNPRSASKPGTEDAATSKMEGDAGASEDDNGECAQEQLLSHALGVGGVDADDKRDLSQGADLFSFIEQQEESISGCHRVLRSCWRYNFNPYGRFRLTWDFVLLCMVFISSIWEPLKAAYLRGEDTSMEWWEWVLDGFFYFDIIVNFFTGFDKGYEVVMDRKLIAMAYIKGWFIIDLISTIEWDQLIILFMEHKNANISLCRLIKVLRLGRASRLLSRLTMTWTIHTSYIDVVKFFGYVLIIAHILACTFFLLPSLILDCVMVPIEFGENGTALPNSAERCEYVDHHTGDKSWRTSYDVEDLTASGQYINSLYWSLTTMTTIGYGDRGPSTQGEIVFTMIAEVIGLSVFALLMQQISYLNDVIGAQEQGNKDEKNRIVQFMKYNNLDKELIQEVVKFLNFKSQSHSGHTLRSDRADFRVLSETLRTKIQVKLFKPALTKVRFFGHSDADAEETREIRASFDKIDKDGGGTLDEDEIGHLIASLGNEQLTAADRRKYFEEMLGVELDSIESSGSSRRLSVRAVTFEQFANWWHRKKYFCEKMPKCTDEFLEQLAVKLSNNMHPQGIGELLVPPNSYGERLYFVMHGSVVIHHYEEPQKFSDGGEEARGLLTRALAKQELLSKTGNRNEADDMDKRLDKLAWALDKLPLDELCVRATAAGFEKDWVDGVKKKSDPEMSKRRRRKDREAVKARLSNLSVADLQKRVAMTGDERAMSRIHDVKQHHELVEELLTLDEKHKVITSHDDEPVFGLTAALWPMGPRVYDKVFHHTRHWVAKSCDFCDITYIDRVDLEAALELWPDEHGVRGGQKSMARLAWTELGLSGQADEVEEFLSRPYLCAGRENRSSAAQSSASSISSSVAIGAQSSGLQSASAPPTIDVQQWFSLERKLEMLEAQQRGDRAHLDTRLDELGDVLQSRLQGLEKTLAELTTVVTRERTPTV